MENFGIQDDGEMGEGAAPTDLGESPVQDDPEQSTGPPKKKKKTVAKPMDLS